jgi:hypothetical protein
MRYVLYPVRRFKVIVELILWNKAFLSHSLGESSCERPRTNERVLGTQQEVRGTRHWIYLLRQKGKLSEPLFSLGSSLTGRIFYDSKFMNSQTDTLIIYYLFDESFIFRWVKSQMVWLWQFLVGGWSNRIWNQSFRSLFLFHSNNISGFATITWYIDYTTIHSNMSMVN